ncbi:MAG: mandelate racemase/muconate lactonizing enzyme family protein [Phycisphaerales bacterium]|nr:mandelate racemase/muconate lactonizing enzyme family protein [Phycisphaerales bacterium]
MKITDIQALHLRIEDPAIGLFDGSYDDCLIVVRTDEGLTGIGEVESLPAAIQALVYSPPAHNHARGLRELLMGENPTDPVRLWHKMYEATDYIGRRGLAMHAIGGIDIALWDIAAQSAGKPIHQMFPGGMRRDRIAAYGTIYPLERTPDGVARQVSRAMAMNLRNIKFAADPWWLDDLDLMGRLFQSARRTLGDAGKIIVDAALSYKTVEEGLRLFPIYKETRIDFLEAPLPLDDVDGHAQMARHGIPLGVGDLGLTHVSEFIEAMDRGGAAICQPDITMVGGFTGLRSIAAAAGQRGKRIITHGYKTNIEIAANLHFLANHEQEEMLEYSTSHSPLRWKTTIQMLPVEADGTVLVPRSPGLGVTPDWEFVMAHLRHTS